MLECMLFLFLTQECIFLPSYFSFSPAWDKGDMMVSGELRSLEDQSAARSVADGDRGMVAM